MKTILVLTDFSERAFRAAKLAHELALNNNKNVVLYHSIVHPETGLKFGDLVFNDSYVAHRQAEALIKLEAISVKLNELVKKTHQPATEIILKIGKGAVPDSIVSLVSEYDVWMIVMGNRLVSDLQNLFFESNVSPVTNNAGCPVLLVP